MGNNQNSYRNILKVTSIFASVRILTIIVNVVKNKIVAILLGTAGIGYFGVFSSTLSLITSLSDFGLSKSSVRNISEAMVNQNEINSARTIMIFQKLLYFTSIFGTLITALLSYKISIWTFGTPKHFWSFLILSIAVYFALISQGQIAILQGMRKVNYLAKASSYGAIFGLIFSIPIIYFLKVKGIVWSLVVSSFMSLVFSKFFLSKLSISYVNVKKEDFSREGRSMLSLGLSMMIVSVMVAVAGFILRAYINHKGSIEAVGVFQAGYTIITAYFGLVLTSITTDYFPRLSAVNRDNRQIEFEVNKQADLTVLLLTPLVTILLLLMPFLIKFLYSEKFLQSVVYVNWAIFGIIFQACSQMMGMVLLAKNNVKVYVTYVLIFQLFFIVNNIYWYNLYLFKGLGISYSINMLLNLIFLQLVMYKLYKISYKKRFMIILSISIFFALCSFLIINIENSIIKYLLGGCLSLISLIYTIVVLQNFLEIKSFKSLF